MYRMAVQTTSRLTPLRYAKAYEPTAGGRLGSAVGEGSGIVDVEPGMPAGDTVGVAVGVGMGVVSAMGGAATGVALGRSAGATMGVAIGVAAGCAVVEVWSGDFEHPLTRAASAAATRIRFMEKSFLVAPVSRRSLLKVKLHNGG
jgi:hypothetical protein